MQIEKMRKWINEWKNSRKSVRWSAVPVPCLSRFWLKLRGEQGSGPKRVDDLCFHTGEFSPPPSPPPPPPTSRPISQPQSPYPSLEAQIPVLRPKSLKAWSWGLKMGFKPWRWDLGLKTGIWVLGLGYGLWGWDMGLKAGGRGGTKKKKKKKEEKISHMCESIGHRPLRGRCPKMTFFDQKVDYLSTCITHFQI